ncbi:hypothetical protein [Dactylosporangium sp. NPDC005555]|uniref:hypothetical protein n=1 Tax=Dactylosporangium sp. NPDC005555 TaxID=3154889 RepID=UPI0033B12786
MELQHADVYRYCVILACGDEAVARTATAAASVGAATTGGPAAVFAAARAAVKEELRGRPAPCRPPSRRSSPRRTGCARCCRWW